MNAPRSRIHQISFDGVVTNNSVRKNHTKAEAGYRESAMGNTFYQGTLVSFVHNQNMLAYQRPESLQSFPEACRKRRRKLASIKLDAPDTAARKHFETTLALPSSPTHAPHALRCSSSPSVTTRTQGHGSQSTELSLALCSLPR